MKRNAKSLTLIVSMLLFVAMFVFGFDSCKKKTDEPEQYPAPHWESPEPGPNGTLPESIIPESLMDSIGDYFNIYSGENPPILNGEFVSRPHTLLFANYQETPTDTIGSVYSDRYIAFFGNEIKVDFYGMQYDPDLHDDYEEVKRNLHVIGTGEAFTCYYFTEGYPNGMYAKQSTVFSGKWNDSLYHGLKDFQVAVILLENSGNPALAPVNSFRILGDGDGLALDTAWLTGTRAIFDEVTVTDEDLFRMFRVK